MEILVITGNIGSGKSAASQILSELGVPVYDSDSRARALYDDCPGLVERIEAALGGEVCLKDASGRLDRRKLADIIFSDPESLEKVESIVHPEVIRDFYRWAAEHPDLPLVGFESAIILTKPLFCNFGDHVLEITAPEEIRIARACRRDGAERERIMARIRTQMAAVRLRKPDYTIENSGNIDSLKSELLSLYLYLSAGAAHRADE